MKNDKSRSQLLKFNAISETLKKEMTIQRQATKKYQKFKKSASQPAYFLDKSRLKKISDIYRVMSLEKLSKNSLNRSKSLHNNFTPQKKTSVYNNNPLKKQSGVNTLNLNKVFETNEKTKRLRLDKTIQSQAHHMIETTAQSGTKFFMSQVDRLEQISNLSIEKVFIGQYDDFFKSLKQECFSRKGYNSEIKTLVSKFCYLMELCQKKIIKINEKDLKAHYSKIQMEYSNTYTELKKKSFKMELLIKEIDQLKVHNMKIAKELYDLKEQKKKSFGSDKSIKQKRRLQITDVIQLKIHLHQAEITTPIYHQHFGNKSQESQNQFENIEECKNQQEKICGDKNQQKIGHNVLPNQRLQMIKRIRILQKKQKDLVKTLLVLKSDGIDVERAFNDVASGHAQDIDLDESLRLKKDHTPAFIRKMKNKDSYDADSSVVESIDGLTVRYLEGEPEEEYIFYPIKHEYKSKPLDESMQNKLKLNFNVLYEDQDCPDQLESEEDESPNVPTI